MDRLVRPADLCIRNNKYIEKYSIVLELADEKVSSDAEFTFTFDYSQSLESGDSQTEHTFSFSDFPPLENLTMHETFADKLSGNEAVFLRS